MSAAPMMAPPASTPARDQAPVGTSGTAPGTAFGFPPSLNNAASNAALFTPDYFQAGYVGGNFGLYNNAGSLPMDCSAWLGAFPTPELTPSYVPDGFSPPLTEGSQGVSSFVSPFGSRSLSANSMSSINSMPTAQPLPQVPTTNSFDSIQTSSSQQSNTSEAADPVPSTQPQAAAQRATSPSSSASPPPSPRSRTRRRKSRSPSSPLLPEDHRARAAHNIVEKHYRRRLNAQFAALLDALPPHLRPDGEGDASAAAGGKKVRKAEVLDLARQYIENLERVGSAMRREREMLVGRLQWMEKGFVG